MGSGLPGARLGSAANPVEEEKSIEAEPATVRHRPVVGIAAPAHHTNLTRVTHRHVQVKEFVPSKHLINMTAKSNFSTKHLAAIKVCPGRFHVPTPYYRHQFYSKIQLLFRVILLAVPEIQYSSKCNWG